MDYTSRVSRVVVTGMGAVTAIGQDVETFWSAIKQSICGITPLEGPQFQDLPIRIAAQIKGFDHRARLKHWKRDRTILQSERVSWLAAAAADEAIAQAGLELPLVVPGRAASVISSALGGQISAEKACRDRFVDNKRAVHPMLLPRIVASSASAHVGIEYGVEGPTFSICSAGAGAAHAISIGRDYLQQGVCDVAIVGGTDSSLTFGGLLSAHSLNLLSPQGCFPFAEGRSGTVLAEGAGILILESLEHAESRGAPILAEICGTGMSFDPTGMLAVDPEAAAAAMRFALQDAGLRPSAIDYLNANGTGTRLNDLHETEAIKQVFGGHAHELGVSSTKSMHGHVMGATSAIEAIASIMALKENWMPPTIGLAVVDPSCDLDYVPNKGRSKHLRYVMSNSFALGGFNASLVLGPPPA